ncbi:MAG: amino acid permease [Rhodanobacter sp.]
MGKRRLGVPPDRENRINSPDNRKIGFWTCIALVVGNTIGVGIFLLPSSLAPYGLNSLIGWAIPLLGCLALARVLSSLAHALPQADGPYGYIRGTLGELPAFVALWAYWVSAWLTNAALAIGVIGYVHAVFPATAVIPSALLALCLLWPAVLVNLFGVRAGGGVQIVTTALKLLPILAVALLGAWILLSAPATYVAHTPTTPISMYGVMTASTIALYAMLGFESGSVPAARVKDPGRTIPRATMLGTLLLAIIYMAASTVLLLLIPQRELSVASAPFSLLVDRFVGVGSGRWLALFVVVSGVGAINGWTLLVGELTRTMASNGVMPAIFARNNRHGAPAAALILTSGLASIMVLMNYSQALVAAFTFVSLTVTAATLPLYLGCAMALVVLWRRGTAVRSRRDALPAAVIGIAFVIFAFAGAGREPLLLDFALAAAGLPLYAFMKWRTRVTMPPDA